MRENIARALGAREQVLAVVGVEELAERLDPADDHQEIVLALQREHRIDEIVPRALVAELNFQAVGEEGEEILNARLQEPEVRLCDLIENESDETSDTSRASPIQSDSICDQIGIFPIKSERNRLRVH